VRLLQDFVRDQAQERPDAIAVVMGGQSLTYGELESSTNRLARLLKEFGCQRQDRIAFAIPKSPAAIVAILAILKADCVHIPLDTASPAPRVAKILRAGDPHMVLGASASANLLRELFAHEGLSPKLVVGWMDEVGPHSLEFNTAFSIADVAACSSEGLNYENQPDDPAHILFTSGSTGEPKGVVITHANVLHFIDWAVRYFGMNASDRVSGHPPLHFDLSTFDIFGAFASGAALYLVPAKLSLLPNMLADFIRESELTQWFSVPSALNYMAKFDVVKANDFPSLKRLLWCGEVFPVPALRYWMERLPHVQFTNLYGPTETTIASSYYTVTASLDDSVQSIPIGTACEGESLTVLDESIQPVAEGEVGDLFIGGAGLSPGYWRNSAATQAAFITGPGGSRLYRTGDLAKVGSDGLVYFVGRADTQIKSRGYRIELGEIEGALAAIPELKQSAVVALATEGFETNLICCAYVSQEDIPFGPVDLRRRLSAVLPTYMLPSHWLKLALLPENANGKIDRPTLRKVFSEQISQQTLDGEQSKDETIHLPLASRATVT
jgi:amino acid adenylation domain-containing protein